MIKLLTQKKPGQLAGFFIKRGLERLPDPKVVALSKHTVS